MSFLSDLLRVLVIDPWRRLEKFAVAGTNVREKTPPEVSVGRKLVYTPIRRKVKKLQSDERGGGMRFKTRFILAITVMIFASASARSQVEKAAARSSRPL